MAPESVVIMRDLWWIGFLGIEKPSIGLTRGGLALVRPVFVAEVAASPFQELPCRVRRVARASALLWMRKQIWQSRATKSSASMPENLRGFRILVVLRGLYGNARHNQCKSNQADRYHVLAVPPLMHRKAHAGPGNQQRP